MSVRFVRMRQECICMSKKEIKTNVMRILDKEKVAYTAHFYEHEEGVAVDGVSVAKMLSQDPERVFKTLVLQGKSKAFYVFVIPVEKELDLKLSASAVGEKSVEMIHVKDINQITGYIRGGCSPIGMKKSFKTTFHEDINSLETVTLSAGRIGSQIEISPADILKATRGQTADIIVK